VKVALGARRAVLAAKAERPVSASKAVVCRSLDHELIVAGITGRFLKPVRPNELLKEY